VNVLDVRGLSPITDFFVIATGTSGRQMRSVADEIEELGQPRQFTALSRNGYEGESWILTDFVDVVLHIFNTETRGYYDLDNLWGDAPRVDWQKDGASR
jgi:ribosome-associated protein